MESADVAGLLQNILLIVFLWSMNLGQGMSFTLQQIMAPFKRTTIIVLAVLLNSVLIPLLYWGLALALPMSPDATIGFLLVGFAAAAPFAIKVALIENGDVPLMIGLVVLLGVLNVFFIPFWSALLMPAGTTVDVLRIAMTLILLVLLPLGAGLFLRARWPARAGQWAPGANKLSTLALVLFIALMLVTSWQSVLATFGSLLIVAAVIAISISMIAGYFVGGKQAASRRTVASVSGMRAVGPALAIASSSFGDKPAVSMAVIVLEILIFLPLVIALIWRGWDKRALHRASEIRGAL